MNELPYIYRHEYRHTQKGWSDIRCTQILNVDETRKQHRFLAIKGTLALTQRLLWARGSVAHM